MRRRDHRHRWRRARGARLAEQPGDAASPSQGNSSRAAPQLGDLGGGQTEGPSLCLRSRAWFEVPRTGTDSRGALLARTHASNCRGSGLRLTAVERPKGNDAARRLRRVGLTAPFRRRATGAIFARLRRAWRRGSSVHRGRAGQRSSRCCRFKKRSRRSSSVRTTSHPRPALRTPDRRPLRRPPGAERRRRAAPLPLQPPRSLATA
jgi:hypothetical protein